MIKLSVIIPIYNVEKYISKCINSLYNQKIKQNEFEIIVVDDESPDNSIIIVEDLANLHSNILIYSQKNKGLGGARNTGIKNANGHYLLFLDSDDYIIENTLHNIIKTAFDNDLDILEFGCQGILPNGKIAYQVSKSTNGTFYNGVQYYNKIKYMNSACNKLYNRRLLIENNLFFVEKIYIEDFEFNTRVFYYAKKVLAINNVVAHYLQSPNSITRNTSTNKKVKMLNDQINVLKRTKEFSEVKKDAKCKETEQYFGSRLSFINISIFYHLLKTKSSYKDFLSIKQKLKKQHLFYKSYSISNFPKDLFRIVCLNNFWLFKFIKPIQNLLSKFK